jgi:hypothetical protein
MHASSPAVHTSKGAEVAIVDSGYTRHYADLKAWAYSEEFIDATWLMSLLAKSGISAADNLVTTTSKSGLFHHTRR